MAARTVGATAAGNPRRVVAYGRTQRQAREKLAKKIDELGGELVLPSAPEPSSTTVKDWLKWWLSAKESLDGLKRSSIAGYRWVIDSLLVPAIGANASRASTRSTSRTSSPNSRAEVSHVGPSATHGRPFMHRSTTLSAEQLVAQYKDLGDIERGFRIMKNQLDLGPVYHRLPDRIRAHTFLCFLALVIQRALRHRLHRSALDMSPREMLYGLRSEQRHSVGLATGKELEGLSAITPEQRSMFDAAGVPLPTLKRLDAAT